MRPCFSILAALAVSVLLAGGVARANAVVGASTQLDVRAIAATEPDQIKAQYRRPDAVPFPEDNRYTPAKALLGQMLFHDTRISGSGTLACASCHNAAYGYGDGLTHAVGQNMKPLPRRTPSIINSAWGDLFMWDGGADSLETQALIPLASAGEMNEKLDDLVQTLHGIAEYTPLFAAAFGNVGMRAQDVALAIATYERTIVSGRAPFDAWIDGEEGAISPAARRGFALFNDKARCALCHSGWNFTDGGFHDIGLPDNDPGRGNLEPRVVKMQHAFKTPSLREMAHRGPFMHDGSLPSLAAVIAHYNAGGAGRPSQSELVGPLHLSAAEQGDLAAFINSLTSAVQPDLVAALPR